MIYNNNNNNNNNNFKNMKEKKELIEKYEKMYFLEGVPNEDKEELSQIYEDFINFLIKLDEKSVVGDRFEILFIPIIKKLYTEFKETDYISVYEMYKTWYSESGLKDGFTKTDISEETLKSDDYHFNGFIEYYKSFKLYIDDTVKDEVLKYTLYDGENGGISKPEYKFTILIKTLNFENKSGDEIKLIIDEAGLLLNYENCYVTMFAIGKLNGEVFSVNETDDDFGVLNKHLSDGKTIVLYSAKIVGKKVFYRYSLIEDKPLDRIEEIKKNMITKEEKIIEKYENLSFLVGVPEENKLELSQLYEDFTNFLINIGEDNLVWGECDFELIYMFLTKKLYVEFKETDYKYVYEMFKKWFDNGVKKIEDFGYDESYLTLFTEHYKIFKEYEIWFYNQFDCLPYEKHHGVGFTNVDELLSLRRDFSDSIIEEQKEHLKKLNIITFNEYKNFKINSLMNRIEKIKEIVDKSDNVLFFDKHELESLKKITKSTKVSDYEVLTDTGFVDIEALHETIPYEVYELELSDGKKLKCADNHIVFNAETMEEVFVKNLKIGDIVKIDGKQLRGTESIHNEMSVKSVTNLGYEEIMYDLELKEGSNRRFYTNGILSHNTLLAKLLAETVYGDSESLIRMDMSEYMEKHSVSRLVGAPPGYVGFEQGGQLTEKVRRKPHCVILFDEIEKAHEDVFNILLQVLDEGRLTDGLGRKVNFKNALIILTSNVGVQEANNFGKSLGFETSSSILNEENRARDIIQKALKKKFKPEFLNRIDEAIIFKSLSQEDIHKIIYLEIASLEKRLSEINFKLKITKEAVEFLGNEGYDAAYGARPLARTIQHYVEDKIADEILGGSFKEGDTISIDYDGEEIKIKNTKTKK